MFREAPGQLRAGSLSRVRSEVHIIGRILSLYTHFKLGMSRNTVDIRQYNNKERSRVLPKNDGGFMSLVADLEKCSRARGDCSQCEALEPCLETFNGLCERCSDSTLTDGELHKYRAKFDWFLTNA